MKEGTIAVNQLTKIYKIVNSREGMKGHIVDFFLREYSKIIAVNKISFFVNRGEIVGFLGPNGSGKSTTIKMLTGILKATEGEICVNGLDPNKYRTVIAKDIGVVFGQRSQLWWALPVIESFKMIKEIYQIDDQTFNRNMTFFESVTDIKTLYSKRVRELSLGQRTLCEVLAVFLHDPKIVFLDEPTIGLDISVKEQIHNLIIEINRIKKTTIILTTHDLADVEAICRRVIILNKGEIICDCGIEELKDKYARFCTVKILIENNEKSLVKIIENTVKEEILLMRRNGKWMEIVVKREEVLLKSIISRLKDIRNIVVTDISVEDIVRKIYEDVYERKKF